MLCARCFMLPVLSGTPWDEEAQGVELSWMLLHVPLPLAGFNLYAFAVITKL